MPVTLILNGEKTSIDAAPDTPLLWALRDHLGLTGVKFGCGIAQCGACTVHIDDQPLRACVTPLAALENRRVTTIEGLSGPIADALRDAWTEIDVPQCGYCQGGQLMSAAALLAANPDPSDDDIDQALAGNICRCASYMRIRRALKSAAAAVKG